MKEEGYLRRKIFIGFRNIGLLQTASKTPGLFSYSIILGMAAFSLILITHFLGFNPFGSAIVVAYSEGLISYQSAALGIAALLGSSALAVAILSNVTVGDVLGEAAAEALVETTLLAWMGPWALVFLAAVIIAVA